MISCSPAAFEMAVLPCVHSQGHGVSAALDQLSSLPRSLYLIDSTWSCIRSSGSHGPNMVLYQGEALFGHSLTKWLTTHWALIKLLQKKYLIWFDIPSLHHLAADAWSAEITCLLLDHGRFRAKKNDPIQGLRAIYRAGDIRAPDWAMFTEERKKTSTLERKPHFIFLQTTSFCRVTM